MPTLIVGMPGGVEFIIFFAILAVVGVIVAAAVKSLRKK